MAINAVTIPPGLGPQDFAALYGRGPVEGSPLPMNYNMGQPANVPMAPVDQNFNIPNMGQQSIGQQMMANPQFQHVGDVLNEYINSKTDQQQNGGLTEAILAQRFQPSMNDVATAGLREAQSYAQRPGGMAVSPYDMVNQRMQNELSPYTTMMDLNKGQSGINLQNAQAGYYNDALQRSIAEKQFEYQNNPQMQQANTMNQYLRSMSGMGNGQPQGQPQGQVQGQQDNSQRQASGPRFNPMGAMLAKQFGLENMQIGASGQPEMIPGTMTPGQKDIDTNFAQSYQTYANAGGALRTQNAINTVQQTIDALRSNKLKTGGVTGAFSLEGGEPSWLGKAFNPDVLVARNNISTAILPQAKSLFGARVTNFDAQSLINSQGLDPMASNTTNIAKLENLINALRSGQSDLQSSGQYFQQHGTLAGYQPLAQPPNPSTNNAPSGITDGATATNQQTGEKIIYKNGQWGPLQ